MNVLQPRLMQGAVGIHPIVVLGSVLIGRGSPASPAPSSGSRSRPSVRAFFLRSERTSCDRTVAGRAARRVSARGPAGPQAAGAATRRARRHGRGRSRAGTRPVARRRSRRRLRRRRLRTLGRPRRMRCRGRPLRGRRRSLIARVSDDPDGEDERGRTLARHDPGAGAAERRDVDKERGEPAGRVPRRPRALTRVAGPSASGPPGRGSWSPTTTAWSRAACSRSSRRSTRSATSRSSRRTRTRARSVTRRR